MALDMIEAVSVLMSPPVYIFYQVQQELHTSLIFTMLWRRQHWRHRLHRNYRRDR